MNTKHQYLDKYPISKDSEKLIIGTIHPHNHSEFIIPFFYGNVCSLWYILSEAFPNELKDPKNLTDILNFLKKRKIAISDTIIECERKNPTALDKDLIPIKLNHRLKENIKHSNIREILFTSGFKKNNAFKLFYEDILGLKITSEIKSDRGVVLPKEIFGRPVKLTALYSPSGSSNMGIVKSKLYIQNKEKYINSCRPVQDFKIDYYREMFN